MSQPFTRFIGVDLGGGKGKKTALAVLDLRGDPQRVPKPSRDATQPAEPAGSARDRSRNGVVVTRLSPRPKEAPLYDDALLAALLGQVSKTVICIDAPLTLPPCLRCTEPVCPGQTACVDAEVASMRVLAEREGQAGRDHRRGKPVITPYTQRATDLYLRSRGLIARETLGQSMGPLAARAAHLVRALGRDFRLNDNLIEVYPRATLEFLGFHEPYKKRVDRRIEILAALADLSFGPGVWREDCRKSDHFFDAVISAYTGYLRSRDGWRISAMAKDAIEPKGWIWVPPEAEGSS